MEAAHRFTDRCGVHVERDASGDIIVRLSAKQSLTNLRTVAQEFANEALDQVLRFKLAAETEPVRRVLIAQAFSRTDLFATAEDENA